MWDLGTVAPGSLISFISNGTLFSLAWQVACEWGAEISILPFCTAASPGPGECQPHRGHRQPVSFALQGLGQGPTRGRQPKESLRQAASQLEMPPHSTFWGIVYLANAFQDIKAHGKLSLGKTGLSARCGHIWDEQIQRAAMAPLPDAYVMTVWCQSDSLALAGGSSQGTDVNAAVGRPARGPLNGLPLRAAPGGARELRAGVPGHTGAHTSVHHTSGMHVLHSAAQLHEVLPHQSIITI